jgi:tripeptide aminopeptidase
VREESGLFGARHLDPADLKDLAEGYNFDGRSASDVIIGAVGAERWEVEITGRASHAGVAPEQGISATLVAALAIAQVHAGGWFGKVVKGEQVGTSNIGPFGGKNGLAAGDATNVVTDYVHLKGESRSHDKQFVKAITAAYKEAFRAAAEQVKNHADKHAKVKFTAQNDYAAFQLKETAPVVKHACATLTALGLTPNPRTANGGLDANWIVKHGLPVVTFGAGQNQIHTLDEWIDLDEFDKACQVAVALATH